MWANHGPLFLDECFGAVRRYRVMMFCRLVVVAAAVVVVGARAPATHAAPACPVPQRSTGPAAGPEAVASRLGIQHCDGVLTGWVQPFGGLITLRLDPVVRGGGFAPGCRARPSRGYLGLRRDGYHLVGQILPPDAPAISRLGHFAVAGYARNCAKQDASLTSIAPLQKLRLLRGRTGELPRSSDALSETAEPQSTQIAASRSGRLAVAWLEPHATKDGAPHDRLALSVGTLKGRMSRPRRPLGDREVTDMRLVWTTRRRLLLVTHESTGRQYRIVVRELHAARVGRARVLGAARNTVQFSVSVSGNGRAAVAWGTQTAGQEADSPWQVSAAVNRGTTLGPGHLLDPGTATGPPIRDVTAHAGVDGVATFAWTSPRGYDNGIAQPGHGPLRYATADPGGGFSPARSLVAQSTGIARILDSGSGGSLLTFSTPDGGTQQTRRSGGGSVFSDPTTSLIAPITGGLPQVDPSTGGA